MTHQLLAQIRTDIAGIQAELARDIGETRTSLLGEIDALKAELAAVRMQVAQGGGGGGGGGDAQVGQHLNMLGQAVGRVEQTTQGLQQRVDAILARMG